jgi:hypothetical protein
MQGRAIAPCHLPVASAACLRTIRAMKFLTLLLCALALACTAVSAAPKEKKPYVMYAQLLDSKQVHLSDGSIWLMDKGDCFPIHMYKDRQTIVVLQLASATFAIEAYHVRAMKDTETAEAEKSYKANVENYWKAVAKRPKNTDTPKPAAAQ